MVGISLQLLLAVAIGLSGLLAAFNHFRVRTWIGVAATLACIVLVTWPMVIGAAEMPLRQRLLIALACFGIPGVTVLVAAQTAWLRAHPWWLLCIGPMCYAIVLVVGMTAYNASASTVRR